MAHFRSTLDALQHADLLEDPAAIIDELRELEDLKCAAEARQARLTDRLDHIRENEHETEDHSVATFAEVALARRVSPHRGRQLVSLARHLARELPHTRAAFDAGLVSEWRVSIIARESACLEAEHRAQVDEAVAGDARALSEQSNKETQAAVRQLAARLDPGAVARRRRRAETERRVTLRPAPDTMVYLTALLPVAQGVAAYAALDAAANTARATGDVGADGKPRSRGQVMADELVRCVTGQTQGHPVVLRLAMSTDALLRQEDDTAHLQDHGALPADAARAILGDALGAGAEIRFKRLFTAPATGDLVAMESRSRLFPAGLAEFLDLRDQYCRNLWCDAKIRHHDHVDPHARGGPTSAGNGQGLCETCSYVKEASRWRTAVDTEAGSRHTTVITTPTGHSYRSRAPALRSVGAERLTSARNIA